MKTTVSPMLHLFQAGVKTYRPADPANQLSFESGDPQVTLENVSRLMRHGARIRDFLIRPTGVLLTFVTGEQYYAPSLRVGTTEPATEVLAQLVSEAGFGAYGPVLYALQKGHPDFRGRLLPLGLALYEEEAFLGNNDAEKAAILRRDTPSSIPSTCPRPLALAPTLTPHR